MKHFHVLLAWLPLASIILLAVPGLAPAEEQAVAAYCQLSVERLELVLTTLQSEARGPTGEEEKALLERHGTTAEAYYAFAGAHVEELEVYLEEHAEVAEEIESLSHQIDQLIQTLEEE